MEFLRRYWGVVVYAIILAAFLLLPKAHAGTSTWVLSLQVCSQVRCDEVTIEPPEGTTMMDCVKQGQLVGLQWVHDNKPPGWVLKKYRCGPRQGAA